MENVTPEQMQIAMQYIETHITTYSIVISCCIFKLCSLGPVPQRVTLNLKFNHNSLRNGPLQLEAESYSIFLRYTITYLDKREGTMDYNLLSYQIWNVYNIQVSFGGKMSRMLLDN